MARWRFRSHILMKPAATNCVTPARRGWRRAKATNGCRSNRASSLRTNAAGRGCTRSRSNRRIAREVCKGTAGRPPPRWRSKAARSTRTTRSGSGNNLLRRVSDRGKKAQRAQTRQKEIGAAFDRNKLRQPRAVLRHAVFLRLGETIRERATRNRLAISQQRIGFAGQAGKLAAVDPGVLEKLELARNIGVETNKLETASRILRRRRFVGVVRGQARSVFATAPENPMKPDGRHQIIAKTFWTKPEHGDEFLETGRSPR